MIIPNLHRKTPFLRRLRSDAGDFDPSSATERAAERWGGSFGKEPNLCCRGALRTKMGENRWFCGVCGVFCKFLVYSVFFAFFCRYRVFNFFVCFRFWVFEVFFLFLNVKERCLFLFSENPVRFFFFRWWMGYCIARVFFSLFFPWGRWKRLH